MELSFDHKPENAEELNRITKAGGTVKEGRVNGNLNLSRAFGDFMYKLNEKIAFEEQIIISKPDINVVKREGKDTFILMGCDGIW